VKYADHHHSARYPHIGRGTVNTPAGRPAQKPGPSKRSRQAALVVIGLGVASRVARDARTHEAVIVIAIVVAVAAAVARESGNKSMARLKAWDAKATGKIKSATKATVQAVQPGSD
jgi:hypothetical protein